MAPRFKLGDHVRLAREHSNISRSTCGKYHVPRIGGRGRIVRWELGPWTNGECEIVTVRFDKDQMAVGFWGGVLEFAYEPTDVIYCLSTPSQPMCTLSISKEDYDSMSVQEIAAKLIGCQPRDLSPQPHGDKHLIYAGDATYREVGTGADYAEI